MDRNTGLKSSIRRATGLLSCGLFVMAVSVPNLSAAQTVPDNLEPIAEPPPIPERVRSGEPLDGGVTIRPGAEQRISEYRVGGQLRAIRVEPEVGPVYYLVDVDGDGKLDTRTRTFEPDFAIPHWVLFSW